MYYDNHENKWVKSKKSLWLQGICSLFQTGMRSLHRTQKLFWQCGPHVHWEA